MAKYRKVEFDSVFNHVDYRELGAWTFLLVSEVDNIREDIVKSVIATFAYTDGSVIHCRTESHAAMCRKTPDIHFIGNGMWKKAGK